MELFKLLGTIAINNSEANKALTDTQSKAKETAAGIGKSNEQTKSSNKSTESSWTSLKSKVNEYKAQGMTTSQAWRQANLDMKSSSETAGTGIVGAFKKIGAAIATFLVVDKIIAFGKGCLQAAADAQAMESQFSQVFGDLEGKASKSLSKVADNGGISENRLKGSFTKIAAFAKTTGMDTEGAMKLSERAMFAVADSAAFYDRSIEETTESLQSFLKGNYENDAALGLSCTETTRNAAANKLYGKSFNELSESQKQLTLLQMVEDANKASGALGQAARESDTWTNVLGNLKQGWIDFQAVIGAAILPAAIQVVKGMASALAGLAEKTKDAITWAKEHETTMKVIGIAIATLAAAIGAYEIAINWATISTKLHTAATIIATTATSAFGAVMAFLTSPITLTIAAIGALVAAVVVMYNKFDWFKAIVDRLKEGMVNGFNAIKNAVITVRDRIAAAWDEISSRCAPLVSAIKDNLVGAFNDLKSAAQGIMDRFSALIQKFQPVVDIIGGALSSAISTASDWFGKLTDKVGDLATGALSWLNEKITAAREAFNTFTDFVGRLFDKLEPLVTVIRDNLVSSLENLKEPIQTIKDAFSAVADTIANNVMPLLRDILMPIFELLKPLLIGIAGALGGALATALGLISGVLSGVAAGIDGFVRAISGIVEIVANVFGLIVGIFTGDGEKIKESAKGIIDGVCNVFGGLWDGVSGFVSGFVDGVVEFFTGLWDTLVGHSIVPDTINGIVDCFAGLWDKTVGFVSGFVDGVTEFFGNLKDNVVEKATALKDGALEKFNNLKDKAGETWNNLKTSTSEKWESLKTAVSDKATAAKDKATTAFSNLKDKVSTYSTTAKDKASKAWETLKTKTTSSFNTARDKASSAFNTLKDKVSTSANNARDKAASAFSTLQSKVSSHANSARDKASSAWETLKSKTSSAFSTAKEKASSAFSSLKSTVTSHASSTESSASSKFNSMKSKISSAVDSAKSKASSAFSGIKSSILTHVSGAYSTVASKFDSIKSKISSIMDSAKTKVTNAVSSIKSAFNFSWSLPKPKIPRFSVSGGKAPWGFGGKGSLPKISISWYKKAMENAMLLNNPTIFGYSPATGNLLGGGEAGSEVVAGTNTLMKMIDSVVAGRTAAQNEQIVSVLSAILAAITGGNKDILRALLAGQIIKLNEREFGRTVREYA